MALGCGRTADHRQTGAPAGGGAASSGGSGTAVAAGGGGGGGSGTGIVGGGGSGAGDADAPATDAGIVPMHRLRAVEYTNTLHDLLGGQSVAAPEPDTSPVWDAVVGDYDAWFVTADAAAEAAFNGPKPPACSSSACAPNFIDSFGLKAFRRPLRDEERQAFTALYTTLTGQGSSPAQALQQVVHAMLASAQFIFHMEPTDQPDAATATPLDSYALASRLSYSLWSTLPDDELFAVAAQDGLQADDALLAELKRLAADPRASAFGAALTDTWLGLGGLAQRDVDVGAYPSWTPALGTAMSNEVSAYLNWFFSHGSPLDQLLTLDKNFVNATLARLYGLNPADYSAGDSLSEVANPNDPRRGLLGLAAFLTAGSLADRPSPSRRGANILARVLCAPVPQHSPSTDYPPLPIAGPGSLRQRLEMVTADPVCAGCHHLTDPYGLALSDFDGIGKYVAGSASDAKVTLATGESVEGLVGLSDVLTKDERFSRCVPTRIAEYVIGRELNDVDTALITQLADGVRHEESFQDQLAHLISSHAFRERGAAH